MPAMPPAKRRAPALSGMPAARPNQPPATIIRFTFSYTRNCVPRCGATFKQLAPLPLKRPWNPSLFHAFLSSSVMEEHSSPRHIMSVETISSGAHADREMIPATAPAKTSFSPCQPA